MASRDRREERDALIVNHRTFVSSVVGRMVKSMQLPANMFDEFVSAGYLGLVEAAERYDKSQGLAFKSWAAMRIRGAVVDAVRSSSAISGKAYRYFQRMEAVDNLRDEIYADLKTQDTETAREEKIARMLDFAAKGAMVFRLSISDCENEVLEVKDSRPDAENLMTQIEERKKLRALVETLPKKERLIIRRFYFSNRSFSDIAHEKNGLSKSWVSRLHQRAVKLLKDRYIALEKNPDSPGFKHAVKRSRLSRANRSRTGRKRSKSFAQQAPGNGN